MELAVSPQKITVEEFYRHVGGALALEVCAGADGMQRLLTHPRIQKPGLALAGYTRFVNSDRVQIMGETELSYLATLSAQQCIESIEQYLSCNVACVIVTKGLTIPKTLVDGCIKYSTPLFRTTVTSSIVIRKTLAYLDDFLSPRCKIHGTLVDVKGVGVLMTGDSGVGKSETALDLIERGHRLVADDIVEIRRRGEDLVGQASELIQNLIEIRGLGILDISELYGVAATREHKRIELNIQLEAWDPDAIYDRTGLDESMRTILGTELWAVRLPVKPGRNIAGIVEVAARNLLLRLRGHNAARLLELRMGKVLSQKVDVNLSNASSRGVTFVDHLEDEVE